MLGELKCRRTRHRSPRNSAAIRARPWQRPARTAAQAARWPALPPEGRVQAEPAPGLGWLADPGRALAGEQDRSDKLRASAVAGIDGIPASNTACSTCCRITASPWPHRTARRSEGHRHQRCWLVAQLHLSEAVPAMVWDGRPAGAVRGSRRPTRNKGRRRTGTGSRSAGLESADTVPPSTAPTAPVPADNGVRCSIC